jgi:hypothetical protein
VIHATRFSRSRNKAAPERLSDPGMAAAKLRPIIGVGLPWILPDFNQDRRIIVMAQSVCARWREDMMAGGSSSAAEHPEGQRADPAVRSQPPWGARQPRPSTIQEVLAPDWLTLADTVSEMQKSGGGSLYEARMEMFGELLTGVRKAKGFRNGTLQEIEKAWFIGQIGQQGVDWSRSAMLKYGVEYSEMRISPAEMSDNIKRGERQSKFNWDQFWVEIVRMAHKPVGILEDREELYRHMSDFCAAKFSDPPGATMIRDKLAMLYK